MQVVAPSLSTVEWIKPQLQLLKYTEVTLGLVP